MSALSRYYAITGDGETRAKVHRLVNQLSDTIEPSGKLFGDSTITKGAAYPYDKLVCGLIDAHRFTDHPFALKVLAALTAAATPHLPPEVPTDDLLGAHESYTIPENQFIAWQLGGDPAHLRMAKAYIHHSFFDPLSQGQNVLAGRHAYSHVNALCSAAKAFLVLGEEKYLHAAKHGFDFIEEQSFATGGWGPNEAFVPNLGPSQSDFPRIRTLGDSLAATHCHFETCCGSYAHFKLARYLLRITKASRYGDSMERVMYNTVLGAKELRQGGESFYNSNYHAHDAHKSYYDGYSGRFPTLWPCCSGTLPQVAADYRINIYFHDAKGVYVNLYVPSTLAWQQDNVRVSLSQSGSYPIEDVVNIVVTPEQARSFSLRLRIPSWTINPTISINGARVAASVRPGTFATLEREWRAGDRIELELPRQYQLQAVDAEHPHMVALVYGPLVLFSIGAHPRRVTRQQLLTARRHGSHNHEWRATVADGELRLAPFYSIRDEPYSTYLTVNDP